MSTLSLLIEAMKNNVIEAFQADDRKKAAQVTRDYLATVGSLKKDIQANYFGFALFLEAATLFLQKRSKDVAIDGQFDRVKEKYASSDTEGAGAVSSLVPEWESILRRLRDLGENDLKAAAVLLQKIDPICTLELPSGIGAKKVGADRHSISNGQKGPSNGGNLLRWLGEFVIGLVFYICIAGIYYLFFTGRLNGVAMTVMGLLTRLPIWLGKTLGFSFIFLNGVLIFSCFHFAVCGIGKIHYAMGTRGYMLKMLLTLFVLTPLVLPLVLFTGRGLRRTIAGELVVVQAI